MIVPWSSPEPFIFKSPSGETMEVKNVTKVSCEKSVVEKNGKLTLKHYLWLESNDGYTTLLDTDFWERI